jgi:hypothetical protein
MTRNLSDIFPPAAVELGETSTTAFPGDKGKVAHDHSQATGNPHGTTAAEVGAATTAEVEARGYGLTTDPATLEASDDGALLTAHVIPADEYTILLAHFDGADGSTDFVDSAGHHTLTAHGNAQVSDVQAKFGQSLLLDGTGGYVSVPASTDFNFGSADFTVEMWVRVPALSVGYTLFHIGTSWSQGKSFVLFVSGGANFGKCHVDFWSSTRAMGDSESFIVANTWHHIALVRHGNTIVLYGDGVSVFSAATDGTMDCSAATSFIGNSEWTDFFNGHIDELRISKGIARWTSNFTPPTAPY